MASMPVDKKAAMIESLMLTVISQIRDHQGMLRHDRNVKMTFHITGLTLAQTEVSVFTKMQENNG